jgi:hypothetical protein
LSTPLSSSRGQPDPSITGRKKQQAEEELQASKGTCTHTCKLTRGLAGREEKNRERKGAKGTYRWSWRQNRWKLQGVRSELETIDPRSELETIDRSVDRSVFYWRMKKKREGLLKYLFMRDTNVLIFIAFFLQNFPQKIWSSCVSPTKNN